jgi:hypothetical protein
MGAFLGLAQAVCNVGILAKADGEVAAGAQHLLLLAATAVQLQVGGKERGLNASEQGGGQHEWRSPTW